MNREELSSLFTESLKAKLINTEYNGRKVCDAKVDIVEGSWEEEGYGGGSYEDLIIKVKTLSPKGKNSRWENYYIF